MAEHSKPHFDAPSIHEVAKAFRPWDEKHTYRTPHRTLEDRVQGEAEARSDLAGQFHAALVELVEFAENAHARIAEQDERIVRLASQVAQLIQITDEIAAGADTRFKALSTAIEAVWNVTKPRPSRLRRFWDFDLRRLG
jgi:xanthine dehydrogenase molybdopterin-binding subunit B